MVVHHGGRGPVHVSRWTAAAGAAYDAFVDGIDGNDANDGLTSATAKKTFGAITQSANQRIGIRCGSLLREGAAITQNGVSIGAYGTGARPTFIGSTKIATTWASLGSNIWSTALASSPTNLYLATGYDRTSITRLQKNTSTPTTPTVGQWGHTASTLYVYSTIDPNTETYERVTDTGSGGGLIYPQADDITDTGVGAVMSTRNGCYVGGGADRFTMTDSDCSWNVNDNIGGHTGTGSPKNVLISRCFAWGAGYSTAKSIVGGDGDGISFHGDTLNDYSSVTLLFNDIRYCRKSGIGNQTAVLCTAYGNYIEECYNGVMLNPVTYGGATPMVQTYIYNIVKRTSTDLRGVSLEATLAHGLTINLYNNTLYSTVASANIPGVHLSNSAAGATNMTVKMRNNLITGFGRGIQAVDNVPTLDLDYNCVSGNTTNYFDNGTRTPTLVSVAGAHSFTTAPQLTDPANGDFRLQAGSPCIGTGEGLGYTEDQAHNPVPATPDVGALQRVA